LVHTDAVDDVVLESAENLMLCRPQIGIIKKETIRRRLCICTVTCRRHVRLAAEAVVLDMGLYSLPGTAIKPGTDHQKLLPSVAAAAATQSLDPSVKRDSGPAAVQQQQEGGQADGAAAAALAKSSAKGPQPTDALGCVRLYQVLAPKCVARALLFGNNLALKRGARCHDLPYFCAPAAASRSLLDMLLVDGGAVQGRVTRSFSTVSNWAGSRLWLRQKYRLPLVSRSVAGAAVVSASGRQAAGGSTNSPSLLGAQQGLWSGKHTGQVLLPISPPESRAQSGTMHGKQAAQTILEQQQLSSSLYAAANGFSSPAAGSVETPVAAAAGAGAVDGTGGTDSAHGSLQSATTSSSAWPVVSIPIRGLATLWSHHPSYTGASGAGVGGITFVFAAAVLPKALRVESSNIAGQVSTVVGTVVRQTLMAFAAAAAADGSGSGNAPARSAGSSSGCDVCGYMFRECAAEMKYLMAFHSPKVSAG
jgi:hypothetical protein